MTARTPRFRFAPSPTGPLHLGGARTALYNWAAARATGGQFLLRIEDTDRQRSSDEWLEVILEGLRWLGVDWDEGPEAGGNFGPYYQNQRLGMYREAADRLLASGHLYRCYCTPDEVDAGRQRMMKEHGRSMYDRRCRDLTEEQRAAFDAEGRRHSLRFRTPLEGSLGFRDEVRGDVEMQLAEIDDFVVVRHDGSPLYNFACVVDDAAMQITHVVRGEEHLINGYKQLLMFRAMDLEPPTFAHIPLILNAQGKKLSKRDMDVNMLDYRDKGYPVDAVFNYISLLGWSYSGDQDVFTRDEMVAKFRLDGVGKSGARFDEEKFLWMCGDYIRRTPLDELIELTKPFLVDSGVCPAAAFKTHPHWIRHAVGSYHERIQTYSQISQDAAWLFTDVEMDDPGKKAYGKHEDAEAWLAAYAEVLENSNAPPSYPADRGGIDEVLPLPLPEDYAPPPRTSVPFLLPQHLHEDAKALVETLGIKFGHFVQPLRAVLTGTNKGPGLFEAIWLLGKETCLQRLRAKR